MRHLLAKALAVGLLSLAIAGCSGDDDENDGGGLSKEDYIAQADAICQDAEAREMEAGLPPPGGPIDSPRLQKEIVAIARDTLADLEALEPPEGDEEDVAKIVSAVERVADTREKQFKAARAGDSGAETEAESDFFTASQDLGASAGAYGLTSCSGLGF